MATTVPPGPREPAWVSFARYLHDPLGMMASLRARYGAVAFVRFPAGHDFYFVTDAPLIRRMLVDDHAVFVKGRALRAAKRLLGDGLLTSEGADHLRRRRLIQPIFHSSMIDRYGDEMVTAAGRTAARWRDREAVDVNAEMMRLALDIVGRTIFAADVESGAPEIREVLEAGMRVFHRFLLPGAELLWRAPLPATRRFNAAKQDIDAMIARTIEERRDRPADPPGLLDHLLALRDDEGRRLLDDEEIRDEAVTLMLAGHETTAQALTWTWLLLAQHPAAARRMRAELDDVLAGRPPSGRVYARLPYTQAVFREALRLYPPVWALARITTEPYQLGAYAVPKGGTVITSQWVVHRCAEYFDEPERFRPERWLDGAALPPPGSYFPFAAGSRMCIGERFAMLEGVLILATLAQRWEVVLSPAAPAIDARFTLRPRGGLQAVTVERRPSRELLAV
ncbi:MAG TPA: cytochrome P450 [Gaiellales bacterium]|jgi:cytochrome P450